MRRVLSVLVVLALPLALLIAADDPKVPDSPKDAPPTTKVKGQLPTGWKKLGLTDAQQQDVYKIEAKYRAQIDELERQVKALRDKERVEMFAVLTDAQKARLKELMEAKAEPPAPIKPDAKKDDAGKADPKKDGAADPDKKKP